MSLTPDPIQSAFAPAPAIPQINTVVRPQKSSLWIWSTLWLTTFFDALLIVIVGAILLHFISPTLPQSLLTVISFVIHIGAVAIGSFLAVSYVLKRTGVRKEDAAKWAGLAILVPIICVIAYISVAAALLQGSLSMSAVLNLVGQTIVSLSLSYLIIRSQLEKKGD